ncbi:MAG: hypothetical protein QOH90_663, partial [Actinomycetota bacterium]|nr:hypothetical protein [Actinomycetota bacterium]
KIPRFHVNLKDAVGYYEPGERVTDKDGNPVGVPAHFPDNPLVHQLHQTPYDVSNTDYFRDLKKVTGKPLTKVTPPELPSRLNQLDKFVVADSQVNDAGRLKAFVKKGGDLVLTDSALRMIPSLTKIDKKAVKKGFGYVGYADLDRSNPITHGLLATAWQTFAPTPIGYPLLMERDAYWNSGTNNEDAGTSSPTKNSAAIWTVDRDAWEDAGGVTIGTADPPKNRKSVTEGEPKDVYENCYDYCFAKRMAAQDKTEIGTLKVGKGRIVIFGAMLPQPTEQFAHWFGLNAYSVSAAAQTMLLRVLGGKA